jgi:hypothetical protein
LQLGTRKGFGISTKEPDDILTADSGGSEDHEKSISSMPELIRQDESFEEDEESTFSNEGSISSRPNLIFPNEVNVDSTCASESSDEIPDLVFRELSLDSPCYDYNRGNLDNEDKHEKWLVESNPQKLYLAVPIGKQCLDPKA